MQHVNDLGGTSKLAEGLRTVAALPALDTLAVAVLGLGYVGLPVAAYLARHFPVVGYDVDAQRIAELQRGIDRTRELDADELLLSLKVAYSNDSAALRDCNFFIVTVPTPIDGSKRPDLGPLQSASETIGRAIRRGGIVVYESTVYPGATEEICIPVIERVSGLTYNVDFFAGYSPERINPADPAHRLPAIRKITSGSTPAVAQLVDDVYRSIITAGTYPVSSIRVAEAAKIIENVQRDVNIALINELSLLFKKMNIETREVLEAAGTKWNFHYYRPGLVGGHCIGVDPYYLTHKAQQLGFHPEMILAGRRINDSMAALVANDVIKSMLQRQMRVDAARILVMGFAFKQNCPDIRNTKVADLVRELMLFSPNVTVYDPLASPDEVLKEYGLEIQAELPAETFDAVVLAVRHDKIAALGSEKLRQLLVPNGLLYDLKEILPIGLSDTRI